MERTVKDGHNNTIKTNISFQVQKSEDKLKLKTKNASELQLKILKLNIA